VCPGTRAGLLAVRPDSRYLQKQSTGPRVVRLGQGDPLREIRSEHEDLNLVRQMLEGDESAFEQFFGRYFPSLYRFALARLGGDADAAEEVAQQTLCAAIRKLQTFRGEAALFTWLCTFCRHEISTRLTRRGPLGHAVPLIEDVPEIRAALESLALAGTNPETATLRRETARLVQVTLDHLPGHYADALEWKYLKGLAVREIAMRLGLSEKAAESLLTRARNAFRDGFTALAGNPTSSAAGRVPS